MKYVSHTEYSKMLGALQTNPQKAKLLKENYEEGLHGDPVQPVEPTMSRVRGGLGTLSPDEQSRLREYVRTVKTVKEEIGKLLEKANKQKRGKVGGDRTGLTLATNLK